MIIGDGVFIKVRPVFLLVTTLAALVIPDCEFGPADGLEAVAVDTSYVPRLKRMSRPLFELHHSDSVTGSTVVVHVVSYQLPVWVAVNAVAR